MKVRYIIIAALLLIAGCFRADAQQKDIYSQIAAHPEYLDGTDMLCPTGKVTLTPPPCGYKPFYISHYGRHGARYAWQSDMYEKLNGLLSAAREQDNLTEQGASFKLRFDSLYPEVRYRVGDLSRKGWEQQKQLAARMYDSFPRVFKGDARVRAWTSTSTRCVMTMSAFCLGLQQCDPKLDIFENFGKVFLPAILPQDSGNPFRDKNFRRTPLGWNMTWAEYAARNVDSRAILSRIFIDPDKAVPSEKQWDLVSYLYFFAAGMNSLDTDLDFKDIFTGEEMIALWKADCFQFYAEAWPGREGYLPILHDIVAKADERIASAEKGADLRFGHDYTILPLLMLLDVDGMGHMVTDPEDVVNWCPTHLVPMGANVQLVFYARKNAPVLFKVLHNGKEAHLPLQTDKWPYYDWNTFKASHGL